MYRQTDKYTDRQIFYCRFLLPEVENVEKKSFSLIEKKDIEPIAIYVNVRGGACGHIITSVNITISVWTDRFLPLFLNPKKKKRWNF